MLNASQLIWSATMKLPPLTAIRHFNAAATHLSFKAAAVELCVTEGAISRQIKLLEKYYSRQLFERLHRGVQLTEQGHKLYAVTNVAFRQIARISEDIVSDSPHFTLSVNTSFAIRWLLPRLSLYETAYPHSPINLHVAQNSDEDPGASFDARIAYILGNPLEATAEIPLNSRRIMIEWLLPVCAPSLVNKAKTSPISLRDMHKHRLIFNEPTGRDWKIWLRTMDTATVNFETALKFQHDDTAIQAAVAGHGIALANLAYINNELEMGSLVCPLDCEPLPIGAHYFISQPDRMNRSQIKAFGDWVIDCATPD